MDPTSAICKTFLWCPPKSGIKHVWKGSTRKIYHCERKLSPREAWENHLTTVQVYPRVKEKGRECWMKCHIVLAKPSGNPPDKVGQQTSHVSLEWDLPSCHCCPQSLLGTNHGRAAYMQILAWISKLGPWSITLSIVGGGQSTMSWPPHCVQVLFQLQWIGKKIEDRMAKKEVSQH